MTAITSVLLCVDVSSDHSLYASDITNAGLNLLHVTGDCSNLVQSVVQHAPDVVFCVWAAPDEHFFDAIQALAGSSPRPVLVFTASEDVGHILQATACGAHAWVINGYAAGRLASLGRVAQARFAHEQALRQALADASNRLEERKSVDRAKAILMRARALSDDDAFRVLRTASMHSNQRLALVSQHVIHSAQFADGVNRAGQLRMLSQRLVKLYILQLLQSQSAPSTAFKESLARIDANFATLAKSFAQPELAQQVNRAGLTWASLKRSLKLRPKTNEMGAIDALAESLLWNAESLTSSLESTGATQSLQVLNLAGRQRMLSQRFAKYALLNALPGYVVRQSDATALREARDGFEQAQHYLNNIPLSTPAIGHFLARAKLDWQCLLQGATQAHGTIGQQQVLDASEALLGVFDQLSATYESSMQMLMG